MHLRTTLTAAALLLGMTAAPVHAAAFFSSTTTGTMGDATTWGDGSGLTDGDTTNDSVIFELFFDFTPAADAATGARLLWEAGDTSGSSLTIKGDNLLLASRHNSNLETIEVAHGLTAPQTGIQIVSVFDLATDTMTLYVNGVSIGTGDKLENDWAGGNAAALGDSVNNNEIGARPHTYYPGWGTITSYPDAGDANFSFNAYLLDDNDLNDILVVIPEPSSLALLGLGGLCFARRRRRA